MSGKPSDSEPKADGENGHAAPSAKKKAATTSNPEPLHLGKLAFIFFTSLTLIFMQAQFWTVDILTAQNTTSKYIIPCDKEFINGTLNLPDDSGNCERIVMDDLLTDTEVHNLLSIARKTLSLSNKTTGRSIFNFQTGMMQHDNGFVNITDLPEGKGLLTSEDHEAIRRVNQKLLTTLAKEYEIPSGRIHLSDPSYFSRITPWYKMKVDNTEGLFSYEELSGHPRRQHYTAIIHLGTHGKDFNGGRLVLIESLLYRLIEAKKGRVIFFKFGSDTRQYFEKLQNGVHYTYHQLFLVPNATIATQGI